MCKNCGGTGTMRLAQLVKYTRASRGDPPELEIVDEVMLPFDLSLMEFRAQYAERGYREAAANCQCLTANITERRNARLGRAEMPDDVDRFTLKDFEMYPEAWHFARLMAAGRPLIGEDGTERAGLLLVGPYGGGKSVLSGIVFNQRQQVLQDAIWLKFVSMVKRFQETYDQAYKGPTLNELIDQLCKCPLLVIDELGNRREAENGLQVSRDRGENILRILDYRAAKHKPTIITSNLDLDLFYSHLDPALASRIQGLCHVAVMDNGIDFRTGEATR